MNDDILNLVNKVISGGTEGQFVEVKSAKGGSPKIYDTLSSFSNQEDGGVILFGIDEKNEMKIVGVYNPQELIVDIQNKCKNMEPEVRALVYSVVYHGKNIVVCEVPSVEIGLRPVYYKGAGKIKGSYVRVGEADEKMNDYEIYSYEAYKKRTKDDLRVLENSSAAIFDDLSVQNYLLKVKQNKKNISKLDNDEILELTGTTSKGEATLSGVFALGKYPQGSFPQLCITAVVVNGTEMGELGDRGERFVDNARIEGTISEMLDDAVNFVRKNMKVATVISKGKRVDEEEYPINAVREIILNALVHRDYSIYTEGMPIRIEMYSDRIEITNPGGLYGMMEIDQLGRVHSDVRNKTLVSVLETLGVAENRFSGIPTVYREMKEHKLFPPIFQDKRGLFKVVLYNSTHKEVDNRTMEEKLLEFCAVPKSRGEIVSFIGLSYSYAIKKYVEPLLKNGQLAYEFPDKAQSKNQRIVTTSATK
ncbi:MAG: ATP-binding protein [Bacillota bacterium]